MKILKVEIYSPDEKKLREVEFNEIGLSIIYGEVEKPNSDNETSNSIGKTVLLKILNVILGAKNSGQDTIKGLNGYIIKGIIKENNIKHNIKIIIGNSKEYYIDDKKVNITKYKEILNIDRKSFSKQIMLDKRKNLCSSVMKNPTKEDVSETLTLLDLNEIEKIFINIKNIQDEIEVIGKFNRNRKQDITELQKEQFNLEMKKKQIDDDLLNLNNRINDLKISQNIEEIAEQRTILDIKLKELVNTVQLNKLKIEKYKETIMDSTQKEITLDEVKEIYNSASVEIPDMIIKKLEEVENFYTELLQDKKDIYKNQIEILSNKNIGIEDEIRTTKEELDKLSKVISENDSFKEAIKIYDFKTNEKIELENNIGEINGKLTQINSTKEMKGKIDILYAELYKLFEEQEIKIKRYREFMYKIVEKIYGQEKRNAFLALGVTESSHKYKAMPIKIDLTLDGDSGEGISTVKYLLFDLLIMNFCKDIDFLIEDSACFEAIDRRQVKNIIMEAKKISEQNNKQLIISLNKYLYTEENDIEKYIVLKLSEDNTLLNVEF